MTTHTPDLGSVSSGTLRTEDLIPTFVGTLLSILPDADERRAYQTLVDDAQGDDWRRNDELASDILTELITALDELAPPYAGFGPHEGDGADFGYRPNWDAIRDDEYDGTLKRISDTNELPDHGPCFDNDGTATEPTAYLHVNDHGNCTLYVWRHGTWAEDWAIV